MQTLFGFDLSTAQKVMVASVVILVLLVLLGLFVRQIQGGRLRMKSQGGGRTRQPRLGIVDTHDLDRQRQLVLIRRDNVEHLIMIGGPSDVVVETNIVRAGRAPAPLSFDQGLGERPPAYDPSQPEPARAETTRMEPPAPDVLPPLPVRAPAPPAPEFPPSVAPEPKPSRAAPLSPAAEAEVALALGAAIGAAVGVTAKPGLAAPSPAPEPAPAPAPAPAVSPPAFTRDHAPSPTASAVELDNMARQLEEALKRPFSAVRPAGSGPAPVVEPQDRVSPPAGRAPEIRMEQRTPPAFLTESRRAPEPDDEAETEVDAPLPEPTVPTAAARPVPTPIDVEAELEFALGLKPKRTDAGPLSQAAPAPVDAAPDEIFSAEPAPPPGVAAVAAAAEEKAPAAPAAFVAEVETRTPDEVVAAEPPVAPEPVPDDAGRHQSALEEPRPASQDQDLAPKEPAPPEPAPKEPAPETAAAQPAAIDPFSVDAIEAEFARLLGRDPKSKS